METPNYYANIPANVRYSDIPPNAKLLYGEITALSNKEGFCWASDSYFAELYGVSRETVNRWVSVLLKKGFIRVESVVSNNITKRKLYLSCDDFVTGGVTKKSQGVCEKRHTNNTININNVEIQRIYDLYISSFKSNPNMYKLSPLRRQKISKRLKDAGAEMLEKAIKNTSKSDFHRGENDRGWKADLDFIIKSYEQVERLANMELVKGKDVVEYEIDWSKL